MEVKKRMPLASIGADVIVGFPGESDHDFEETYSFLKDADLSYLHVFPYSERKNTAACSFEYKVESKMKESRSARLLVLSEEKKKIFYQNNIGKRESVIFETALDDRWMRGFTSNYIAAQATLDQTKINALAPVEMKSVSDNGNMEVEIKGL